MPQNTQTTKKRTERKLWGIQNFPVNVRKAFVGFCAMRGIDVADALEPIVREYLVKNGQGGNILED